MPNSSTKKCATCGTEFQETESPSGLCPACLMKLALSVSGLRSPAEAPAPARQSRWPVRIRWIIAAAALLAALLLVFALLRQPSAPARTIRFTVDPSPARLLLDPPSAAFALSPDGQTLAFVAQGPGGKPAIWIRTLDSFTSRQLTGTEDSRSPFWSPDSRALGFFARGKLRRVDVNSGIAQTLCDAPGLNEGAWSRDGRILFGGAGALRIVSSSGGVPQPATRLDPSRQDLAHHSPEFLPDGDNFLFVSNSRTPERSAIHAGSLQSQQIRTLRPLAGRDRRAGFAASESGARGYLVFLDNGALLAQPFDAHQFSVLGDAVLIAEAPVSAFSLSHNGTLAYTTGRHQSELAWFDREGRQMSPAIAEGEIRHASLAPGGNMIAYDLAGGGNGMSSIWLHSMEREVRTRLTFGSAGAASPVWSPDARGIAFLSAADSGASIRFMSASGTQKEEILYSSPAPIASMDWSPDGRFILFAGGKGNSDLWSLPLAGDRRPAPIANTSFEETSPAISPDARWLAYASNESGRQEVYLQTLPAAGARLQISNEGGSEPRWRRDGRELFYLAPDGALVAVAISIDRDHPRLGRPQPLFHAPSATSFAVTSNGTRFLVVTRSENASHAIHLVIPWRAM